MSHTELQIETADGHCPTHVYHPSGNGPWPGVIMYMDGIGMGGRLAVYAAGHFGDRAAAAASYHGSGLATDAPDSPHRLAPRMTARVYVAGAIKDPNFDDAQKARLEQALSDAEVDHTIETYNAMHGFVPRDTPVHDEAATARHWQTLLALFAATLKPVGPQ